MEKLKKHIKKHIAEKDNLVMYYKDQFKDLEFRERVEMIVECLEELVDISGIELIKVLNIEEVAGMKYQRIWVIAINHVICLQVVDASGYDWAVKRAKAVIL